MAAPGGCRDVRVRLMFEYPPPALPQNRQLWFMLDTERCRAVTDVSAIIQERFFYSQRGALSLYLDGCLLPPGESVRLIRDNDAISVIWEGSPPHDSPHLVSKKRRRAEDESDDCRDQEKMRVGHRKADEEECSKQLKKKRAVTPEEDEVCKWSKKKKKAVTLEDEIPSHRLKKKKEVTPEKEKASERPKKKVTPEKETPSEQPQKKKKEVTPEEEIPSHPPKKKVTPQEEISSDRPKKKKKEVTLEMEIPSERPKKKDVILEEDKPSERPKPYSSTVQKAPPPSSTVQKAPPPSSTYRKEASSSSCDTEHRGGQGRMAEPGHSPRTQQTAGFSTPPMFNGHVAGRGADHRSPLVSTGRGVGRGRGLDNLSTRGGGFHGRGKAQLQNHFFYNYSPEATKQQQLNEDVRHVSVVIQNSPEAAIVDYSALPLLAAPPQPGKVIAFKLLELTENYTPEISDYKEGRVLSYDPVSQNLEVEVLSQQKKKEPGKFDLVYEGEDGTDIVEYAVPQECKISQPWSSLIEPRLVTEHMAAVTPSS